MTFLSSKKYGILGTDIYIGAFFLAILVIIIVTLLIIGLSGCVSLEQLKEEILGKWLVGEIPEGEDGSVVFHFFSNGSFYLNLTEIDEYGDYVPKVQQNLS